MKYYVTYSFGQWIEASDESAAQLELSNTIRDNIGASDCCIDGEED